VYHPEPLRLELWIDEVRGASFTVHYEVYDGEALAAVAATTCVAFDFGTDRPRRMTAEERELLAGFADDRAPAMG
jgi:acyl-CoA thioester hydrolase